MTRSPRVLIFGSGGHGKVVADVARSMGFTNAGFIDDDPSRDNSMFFDLPVLHWDRLVREREAWRDAVVALGIGSNSAREEVLARLDSVKLEVATLVHAAATLAPSATLGRGAVVMAAAVINPCAVVGPGAIVNTGAIIEHDCQVGSFAHLSPKAALGGAVHVGDRSHLGVGAAAIPLVRIGRDVIVGAGAVVISDIADGLTVVGVPARPVQRRGNQVTM